MPYPQVDVKSAQVPSASAGVPAAPPAAPNDVKPNAPTVPSAEGIPSESQPQEQPQEGKLKRFLGGEII